MKTEAQVRKMIDSLDGTITAFKDMKLRVDKLETAKTVLEWVLKD